MSRTDVEPAPDVPRWARSFGLLLLVLLVKVGVVVLVARIGGAHGLSLGSAGSLPLIGFAVLAVVLVKLFIVRGAA